MLLLPGVDSARSCLVLDLRCGIDYRCILLDRFLCWGLDDSGIFLDRFVTRLGGCFDFLLACRAKDRGDAQKNKIFHKVYEYHNRMRHIIWLAATENFLE